MRRIPPGCRAHAASGHVAVASNQPDERTASFRTSPAAVGDAALPAHRPAHLAGERVLHRGISIWARSATGHGLPLQLRWHRVRNPPDSRRLVATRKSAESGHFQTSCIAR